MSTVAAWHEFRESSTPVSASDIRRFALALEDDDPRWAGTDAVAPPTYVLNAMRPEVGDPEPASDGTTATTVAGATLAAGRRILNGGCSVEIEQEVRSGDVVTSRSELVSRESKSGTGGDFEVVIVKTVYSCDRGVLATSVQNLVFR